MRAFGAREPTLQLFALLSGGLLQQREAAAIQALSGGYAREGMAPLAGCTSEGLARETVANAARWSFLARVDALKSRPALMVSSDDGLAPGTDAFAAALTHAGNDRNTRLHLPTDHAYSDQRRELSTAVLQWRVTLPPKPAQR